MQPALTTAQNYISSPPASQETVNASNSALTAAIAKLIPTTQVNATELYELCAMADHGLAYWGNTILDASTTENPTRVTTGNTSAASWSAYQTALTAAKAELAKLYYQTGDTDIPMGSAVGDATPYNSSTGAAATNVANAAAALHDAIYGNEKTGATGLDKIGGYDDAKLAYDGLSAMTTKLFKPAALKESDYTPASWSAFTTAYGNALSFLAAHSAPTEAMGEKESQAYMDAGSAFWSACYEGLAPAEQSGSVTLSVMDNHAALSGIAASQYAGTYSVPLSASVATVGEALNSALGSGYSLTRNNIDFAIGIYVNGVYMFNPALNKSGASVASRGYENILLHPGDEVVVALMKLPVESNLSGSLAPKNAKDIISDVQYLRITQSNSAVSAIEAVSGVSTALSADYMFALPAGYNGGRTAKVGASVYVSKCCGTEAEARTAAVTQDTGTVTGADGSFSLTLYSSSDSAEGWYALNLVCKGENGGLANGQNVIVHVTDPSDLSSLKSAFLARLNTLYTAYTDDFYTEAQLTQVQSLYSTAATGISAATTGGAASAAFDTAYNGISAIQTENSNALAKNLRYVRSVLEKLPNAADLAQNRIYSTDKLELELLFGNTPGLYTNMTGYQKAQFTQAERTLLEALKTVYAAGIENLPAPPAFRIDIKLYDAATLAPIANNAILTNTRARYTFYTGYQYMDFSATGSGLGDGYFQTLSAFSDEVRAITVGSDNALTTSTSLPENVGYSFEATFEAADGYTVSSAEWSLDEHYYSHLQASTSDARQLNIVGNMLREDSTIKVYLNNSNSSAAGSYLTQLTNAYNAYNRANYTTENWAVLLAAYSTGKTNINAAEDDAARQSALDAAKTAMQGVTVKTPESSTGISGWNSDETFNAGAQVGTVTVIVENNTFPGGAFTGNIVTKTDYALGKNDSMMTVALRALADSGYGWTGTGGTKVNGVGDFGISYLSSITKGSGTLGEFSGEQGSGWMGTLNDFFVNEGLDQFSVANGKLESGDIINVVYTQNLGADVGGTWGNSDTTLSGLSVSSGTLTPAFTSGAAGTTHEYALVISGSSANVTVTPTAANKNYLVKTFLNEKVKTTAQGNSYYKRTEAIPVTVGDTIYIGVGEAAWPSMNNQGAEARAYSATWYELHVISASNGASYASELISALPAASKLTYSNYESYRSQIEYARTIYGVLNATEKAKVTLTKLTEAEVRLAYFDAIQNVKTLLAAIPSNPTSSDRSKVQAAYNAYNKLTDEQKGYITVGDVAKYNNAVDKLGIGQTITGSTSIPGSSVIEPTATVTGNTASATVTNKEVTDAITAAEKAGETAITVIPQNTGSAAEVNVILPKTAAQSIVDGSNAALTIETAGGSVTVPNDALASITSQATGSSITITVEQKTAADVTDKTVDTANAIIVKVTVTSNGKPITSFGGKSLTISIPVDSSYVEGQSYKVIEISDDGTTKVLTGKCVKVDGKLMVQVSTTGLSTFVVTQQKTMPFTDVASGTWFYDDVDYVYDKGLMHGTGDTTFSPALTTTRGMIVTVLYRLENEPAVTGACPFDDVASGEYYEKAVIWAAANDIVDGYGSGKFGPKDEITREQMATILWRYAKYKGYDVTASADLSKFTDESGISGYAVTALSWANASKLINGKDGGILDPGGSAKRCEVAAILHRFCKNIVK